MKVASRLLLCSCYDFVFTFVKTTGMAGFIRRDPDDDYIVDDDSDIEIDSRSDFRKKLDQLLPKF